MLMPEPVRVRQDEQTGLWVVEVLSPVSGCGWIVQGEWLTENEAREDVKHWAGEVDDRYTPQA